MIALRKLNLPKDGAQIATIDTSIVTDAAYISRIDGDNIRLERVTLDEPVTKRFPIGDLNAGDEHQFSAVATVGDRICGLIAAEYQAWNRRLTIQHFYVDGQQRGLGIGRLLLERTKEFGINRGAVNMWAETSNLNAPGIGAYRRLGFELCGFDTTLYQGTTAKNEIALFLTCSLAPATT